MPQLEIKSMKEILVDKQDVADALADGLTQISFQNKDGDLVFATKTKTNGQMVEFELTDGTIFSLLIREKTN
jgi:hypothetical protein